MAAWRSVWERRVSAAVSLVREELTEDGYVVTGATRVQVYSEWPDGPGFEPDHAAFDVDTAREVAAELLEAAELAATDIACR